MKKNKEVKLHIELRKNACEVIKPDKKRVDCYALVESRTGITVRWSLERNNLVRLAKEGRLG